MKVAYSCVVDDAPLYQWQGFIFIRTLLDCAGVNPEDIFIHVVGENFKIDEYAKSNGINVVRVKPFGDEKYCNKLAQFDTSEFKEYDYVFLCDADIAFADSIDALAGKHENEIIGKTVDAGHPSVDILEWIFEQYGIQKPVQVQTYKGATFQSNCNGGLIGIPKALFAALGREWRKMALDLLANKEIQERLGAYAMHVDQISFCLILEMLSLPFSPVGVKFNTPIHRELFLPKILDELGEDEPAVLHYHSSLDHLGQLKPTGVVPVDNAIGKVNAVIRQSYTNALFWDFRYRMYPDLGSGVGSRGDVLEKKRKMLRLLGIEHFASVLDIGCGDCETTSGFQFPSYVGVDISEESLKECARKHPGGCFKKYENREEIASADFVLCLDVLLHQESKEKYEELIEFAARKARRRLVISGYRNQSDCDKSHMCFFHEDIVESVEKTGAFKNVFVFLQYRNLAVVVADKEEDLFEAGRNENAIDGTALNDFLRNAKNPDLLGQCVTVSESIFGWFTKHYPRLIEYPWILSQLGYELNGKRIGDFGAGITPLPFLLSTRGAKVCTVDYGPRIDRNSVGLKNEWGFFDYAEVDEKIECINGKIDLPSLGKEKFDVWLSVSVVEHLAATERRRVFSVMRETLKGGGFLLLTLDLEKDSEALWNRCAGKVVDQEGAHGDLGTVIAELKDSGFEAVRYATEPMPESEKVDIALLTAVATQDHEDRRTPRVSDYLKTLSLSAASAIAPGMIARRVEACRLFDARWYAARHPEIDFQGSCTPASHYAAKGWKTGNDPSELFCTNLYLRANAYLKQMSVCPVIHYWSNGGDSFDQIIPLQVQNLMKPFDFSGVYELGNKKTKGVPYSKFYERRGIEYTSIDLNGLDGALPLDLSQPIDLPPRPMVANIGTSEHVLDQHAVFKNIHRLSSFRMVHWVPMASFHPQHGFWGYPLDFFERLAQANAYEIEKLYIEKSFKNWTLLCCSLRKTVYTRQEFYWDGDGLTFNPEGKGGVMYV